MYCTIHTDQRLYFIRQRSVIPCYWESQPSGCTKQHCPFKHFKLRPAPPTTMSRIEECQTLSESMYWLAQVHVTFWWLFSYVHHQLFFSVSKEKIECLKIKSLNQLLQEKEARQSKEPTQSKPSSHKFGDYVQLMHGTEPRPPLLKPRPPSTITPITYTGSSNHHIPPPSPSTNDQSLPSTTKKIKLQKSSVTPTISQSNTNGTILNNSVIQTHNHVHIK